MKPYGLVSDVHHNDWSMFSTYDSHQRNSRLMGTIYQVARCAKEVLKLGGDTVFCAGDWFHKRGSVAPEVFNPVRDLVKTMSSKYGIKWRGITGNHDLASRESVVLQSSVAMLNGIPGFHFSHGVTHDEEHDVVLFPWVDNPQKYREEIEQWAKENADIAAKCDLICHVGIDGTLKDMPSHGVDAEFFKGLPFKRVFSGHYHNHKDFGDGVYSIGATAHQTWGDVGTAAGYMIVDNDEVRFVPSTEPSFVVLDGSMSEADMKEAAAGNYVMMKINSTTNEAIGKAREFLTAAGAKGISIVPLVEKATTRDTTSVTSLSSIDESVSDYCKDNGLEDVAGDCIAILKGIRQ